MYQLSVCCYYEDLEGKRFRSKFDIATRVLRRFRINQLEISFLCMMTELRLGDMENEPLGFSGR